MVLAVCLAVLETLAEFPDGMPESTLYLAVGSNYSAAVSITNMLSRSGAIKLSGHRITKGPNFSEVLSNLTAAP